MRKKKKQKNDLYYIKHSSPFCSNYKNYFTLINFHELIFFDYFKIDFFPTSSMTSKIHQPKIFKS